MTLTSSASAALPSGVDAHAYVVRHLLERARYDE
jgi:hypothetical protein